MTVARRAATATPAYVQGAYTNPQSPLATVQLAYPAAQLGGDLNVVVVGWNDATAQVTSVSDSKGNSYALAVGPTVLPGALTQSIYYAKAITSAVAGANTVTVTFNVPAQYVDLRVAEYSGVDTTAPLDVTAVGSGTGSSATTATATTTGATDLLVAGTMVTSSNSGAGAGYTLRFITMPDSDLLEDRVVTAPGPNAATAPLGSAGGWIIQMAAFRAAVTGGDVEAPTAPASLSATAPAGGGQINLTWTAATDNVAVTGYRIERCQGAGCSAFAQVGTSTGATFADTGLAISTSYSYRVRANDAGGNLSAYSNVASATTPGDTTAPTAPSALVANPASTTQINLSWGSATDNVGVTSYLIERCQGVGCSSFAQIGTSTGTATTFSSTGLVAGTTYGYRVRAADGAGNQGAYSNVASATTPAPDGAAPSAPGTLTATTGSGTQINVSWGAATDNVGVTAYLVERCAGPACATFAQVTSQAATTLSDTGLAAGTSYSYRVRATDAAGNLGAYSNTASATTSSSVAPPAHVQSRATDPQSSPTSVQLAYSGAQAAGNLNVVVVGWNNTTSSVTGVSDTKGNVYTLAVGPTAYATAMTQSIYYAKNIAAGANTVTVTFNTATAYPDIRIAEYSGIDAANPVDVTAVGTGTGTAAATAAVTTTNASDLLVAANMVTSYTNAAGAGFTLRQKTPTDGDILEDRVVTSVGSYTGTSTLSSGGWIMQMVAFRAAGGVAPPVDTQAPTAPGTLAATPVSSSQINLSWGPATDNVGVTSYLIERCQGAGCSTFAQIGTATATTFSSTGLALGTTYGYRVRATDAAGNLSAYSNVASASTAGDTQAPTAPATLAATPASSSQVNLTWVASTDNVGVGSYLIERCQGVGCSSFAQIATVTGTSYGDTGLSLSTTYGYRVRATDAAGNLSAYSNVASATTSGDAQAPTAPASLVATATSANAINLAWTASTDNVGVTGYRVERCQGQGCVTFAQIGTTTNPAFADPGLGWGVDYSYRVRAVDAAGNLSAYSNVGATQTPFDVQAPTTPTGLTATVISNTQVNLAWTASTDNVGVTSYLVERCQDAGCATFAQIGTTAGVTFPSTGLAAGTSYSFRVRPTDAAGNLGAYSNVASATTTAPDTTAPTAPGTLTAVAASASQINLSWGVATDNVGVTSYLVERCQGAGCATFAQVTSQAATTLSDTGLAVGTSYSYRVRAADAAANTGAYSNTASATTTATVANPVFVQANYADPQTPQTQVQVPFTAAQTAGNLNVIAVGWNDATAQVTAVTDSKGNVYTRAVGPTTGQGMSQSMYYAKNIAGAAAGANTVTVTFSPAAQYPDIRIAEYANIDQTNPVDVVNGATGNSALATTSVTTTFPVTMLVAADMVTSYTTGPGAGYITRLITSPDGDILEDWLVKSAKSWSATAGLSSGGWVIQVVAFKGLSGGGDTEAPSAPGALTASATSMSQIDLSWGAATDNVGVTSYLVESCQGVGCTTFAQIGAVGGTAFSSTGLLPGTSYSFRVRASDAGGNRGAYSAVATAATQTDAQAPTAPASLVASAAGNNQINLTWGAATDNLGVTSYLVERCQGAGCTSFAQVGTSASLAFSNTGLSQGVTYGYRVRATDAAGNLGPYSATASATTTADVQAPSAPGALTASAAGTAINLSWGSATDNVGVTSYLVERCQDAGCGSFAQIATTAGTTLSDGGLTTATAYSYRVRAVDAAGNLSVYSNTASATTSSSVAPPAYVQGNSADPQGTFTTTQVKFTGAQAAGDLNVIAVGWNNTTSQVSSVTDSKGNTYVLAVGPTSYPGVLSQSIYYAKNITAAAAGANTITVTFNAPTAYPDLRIAEYSGINGSNPVDVTAVGTGTATAATTASVTTTNPSDLLVAANMVATFTSAAGAGFTLRTRSATDGDILEDRVVSAVGSYAGTSTLSSGGGWVMQMVAFRSAGSVAPPGDTTPPVVSITAPAAGATLSGTTVVSVTATDASPIGSVQLLVDGTPFGLPDTSSPYQFSVDTSALTNGAHTFGATATDVSANTGAATPVSVTFSNQPNQSGSWSALMSLPIVSVHAELLPNGSVLMSDGQNTWGADARVWDPATNSTSAKKTAPSNIFCGASEQMKDGRILFVGGHQGAHYGTTDTNIFNPATGAWSAAAQMANPRWYPTVMALADGRYMVVGGESNCNFCNVTQAEVYDATANHWSSIGSPFDFPYYPHLFVLPNGQVFVSSTTREPIASRVFDVAGSSWTAAGGPAVDGGAAVMYLPGKVLKTGTSVDPDQAVRTATAASYVIDMTQTSPAPAWRQVASMGFARTFHSLTSLPDGTVIATGGGPTTAATDTANGVLRAELWSPTTETWTLLPPMAAARLYHSEALLLPDGRVAVMGGGRFDDVTLSTDQFSAQIFSPPYLFKGARPTVTSAPSTLSYGQAFSVQTPDAARIASVSLLRFGATTHSFNVGQRYVPLTFTAGSGTLTVTAPASVNIAPGGNYMLFIVDSSGVPSVASIVHF